MKYYAVIDTNVIISSMLKPDSIPGTIVKLAVKGGIIPLFNNEILKEYEDVLSREEFGFDMNDVNDFILKIKNNGIILERTISEDIFPDKDDIVFYEIALTAKKFSDVYLITGNLKHFPCKTFVVTPRQMLDIIEKNEKNNA